LPQESQNSLQYYQKGNEGDQGQCFVPGDAKGHSFYNEERVVYFKDNQIAPSLKCCGSVLMGSPWMRDSSKHQKRSALPLTANGKPLITFTLVLPWKYTHSSCYEQ
jgi:hypothetical protein